MSEAFTDLISQEDTAIQETPEVQIKPTEQATVKEPEKVSGVELIDKGIDCAVVEKIRNDEKVQDRMLAAADKLIDNRLEQAHNDSEREKKEAVFKNNKDACDLYGIDEKTVPTWVVKGATATHAFWYVIWLIVGFFTTAPIVFLSKKIAVVFKRTWIAVLLAIVIYMAIVFIPILMNYIQ